MRTVIKGVLKKHTMGKSLSLGGYRPVWETGRASYSNRIRKVTGINRPSI